MTNLSQLRAELAETNIDVLAPEAALMVKGGGSKGGYKNKKSGSRKKKSGSKRRNGGYGGGHGHGYGGGYGGGHGHGGSCW